MSFIDKNFILIYVLTLTLSTSTSTLLLPSLLAERWDHKNELFQQLLEDISANSNNTFQNRVIGNPSNLYLLYTRKNPLRGQILTYGNQSSIRSSNFNPDVPTVFIMHGWLEDRGSDINKILTNALLTHSEVNVIVVDWGALSQRDYFSSTSAVPSVGRQVGQFVSFLNYATGISYEKVHLVGFSLGAHVAGNAGRYLNGQVARITALDPAGPFWYNNSNKLKKTDAIYVEAIHTNAGEFGLDQAVADADFFPNGGSLQPGCAIATACNHYRAWQLFAASINHNHLIGRECSSTVQLFFDLCRGRAFPMGNNDLKKFGTGMYRFNTRRIYPY